MSSKARQLADLLDASGDVSTAALDNVPPNTALVDSSDNTVLDTSSGDAVVSGNISTATLTTTGGGGGTAIEVQGGGDLVFKNATNTGEATLFCDNSGELKTLNTVNSGGIALNGTRVRAQKQRVHAAVGNTTMNVGSYTALVSVSITVSEGSSCLIMFNGEMNAEGGAAWQWCSLFRDNTLLGSSTIAVTQQSWNSNFHPHWWDENLPAGTYTYSFKVYNGSNYGRWGEHSTPTIQVVEFAK